MDNLYSDCDGVTTPDGLYFDPHNAIEGEWSDKVSSGSCRHPPSVVVCYPQQVAHVKPYTTRQPVELI